jgi:hypothetical protein
LIFAFVPKVKALEGLKVEQPRLPTFKLGIGTG